MSKRQFLREFIKDYKQIGSVTPSSKILTKKITKYLDGNRPMTIVELGTGTGTFTRFIGQRMHPDSKFITFEINKRFYEKAKKELAHLNIEFAFDSAENIGKYLAKDEKIDVVISGLPLFNFPKKIMNNILFQIFENLDENGVYSQYQYAIFNKKRYKKYFKTIDIDFVLQNIPPSFIYHCFKK